MKIRNLAFVFLTAFCINEARPQSLISGRIMGERYPGSKELIPFSAVYCIVCADGSGREPRIFRSWETEPAGWFRLSCETGNHTLLFANPSFFMRPIIWKNVFMGEYEKITDFRITPSFDMFCSYESEWDSPAANGYYQIFTAKSKSLTHIGLKFAHDGVDGAGPGKQDFLISIHLKTDDPPEKWEQIGPTAVMPDVDAGGVKNYSYFAGWNSGEVNLIPGKQYAVYIRPKNPEGKFQSFWRQTTNQNEQVYKVTNGKIELKDRQLWIAIGGDNDGLVIPYNKKVHKQFGEFAGFSQKWAQTYVTKGKGLAGVVLYAAVGGAQPPISRQRLMVSVHRDSPEGEAVGIPKIAGGNGNYTGDSSWGIFATVFAPGEVPLEPNKTYAIVFETIETKETIGNFVNIKGDKSDGRVGFNPYKKFPYDDYPHGSAFLNGKTKMDFDLDMQVIEYENEYASDYLSSENLVLNGDFQMDASFEKPEIILSNLEIPPRGTSGFINYKKAYGNEPKHWETIKSTPTTFISTYLELPDGTNVVARIYGQPGTEIDGALVKKITGLIKNETYVMQCRVRSSWSLDLEHQTMVGVDPTGQTSNVNAKTIIWTNLPPLHSKFFTVQMRPVRPESESISIWLRGKSTFKGDTYAPFYSDFDNIGLFKVKRELTSDD